MHLISSLLHRVARRAGQAQSILREGQQNTSISVTCLWCIFRSRGGKYCKLRRNEHSCQGFPALLTANSTLPERLYILLRVRSPCTSLPLFCYEGSISMPLLLPTHSCEMLSWPFSDNSKLAISAQPPARLASSHTRPGLG